MCVTQVKPDYVDGMGETLDLVVLGGYFGEGKRRAGQASHFLLGVMDDSPNVPRASRFHTLCKVKLPLCLGVSCKLLLGSESLTGAYVSHQVGTGYSLTQLQFLNQKIKWRKFGPSHKSRLPNWLHPSVRFEKVV